MDEKQIAQCVGLWLAEGDTKTKLEITFTNNLPELITFFHNTISNIFDLKSPRIYVYSPSKNDKIVLPIDVKYKFYVDKRAKTPYFIYRVADVSLVKKWHETVNEFVKTPELFQYTLQGIFAGEGNIKFIKSCRSRVVRISQGKPDPLLEKILNYFKIHFKFSERERSYVISGRSNLEKLAKLNISVLNSVKNKKFEEMLSSYKQHHYPRNFLKREIYSSLSTPYTSLQLSKKFNRSQARITRILCSLKKEKKVINFHVRSKSYWIQSNKKVVIISKRKNEILKILNSPKKTSEMANSLEVSWKSAYKRLNELKKLNLVKIVDKIWVKKQSDKKIIVY